MTTATPQRAVKERGIIMSAPMVLALLDGRKTQTRRTDPLLDAIKDGQPAPKVEQVCKRWGFLGTLPDAENGDLVFSPCRFGGPGDRLWVRETWCDPCDDKQPLYRADMTDADLLEEASVLRSCKKPIQGYVPWRPSIFMPRWASRITLEIVGVRVERLHDISKEDAKAEGVEGHFHPDDAGLWTWRDYAWLDTFRYGTMWGAQQSFKSLWESINGPGSWARNNWVWVISFRRIKP